MDAGNAEDFPERLGQGAQSDGGSQQQVTSPSTHEEGNIHSNEDLTIRNSANIEADIDQCMEGNTIAEEQPTDSDVLPAGLQDFISLEGMVEDYTFMDDPPPSPPPPRLYENFPTTKVFLIGAVQVVVGVICIICQAVTIVLSDTVEYPSDNLNFISPGIVSGVYFMVSGTCAMIASKLRTRNVIKVAAVVSIISCGVFCIFLFVMSCVGLSYTSDRYPCEVVKTPGRIYRTCPFYRPLLIVNVTMLVSAIMEFVLSINVTIKCFKTVLGRTKDQLQCIRTPEGHLLVFNKGPDYTRGSSSQQNAHSTFFIKTKTTEILFPMQTRAVLKAPPYALDEYGRAASPPPYKGRPPQYVFTMDTKKTLSAAEESSPDDKIFTMTRPVMDEHSEYSLQYLTNAEPPAVNDASSTYL